VLLVAVGAAGAIALGKWWYDGRFRSRLDSEAQAVLRLTSADLGADLGERATLVQFSSAFCAPCRATRQILSRVANQIDGVRHVEIDAESRLDLVRRLGIVRTPTTLVLDAQGAVLTRASGAPRQEQVIASLGPTSPA
jgi:thiol-disulfide isomerase/thioredoxin